MKYVITADLHLGHRDRWVADAARSAWAQICAGAVREKAAGILVAGDVFDGSNIGSREVSTGSAILDFLGPITGIKIPVLVLLGNHDYAGPGQADALAALDGRPGITVVRRPAVIDVGELRVACLPWTTKAHLLGKEEHRGKTPTEAADLFREKALGVLAYLGAELHRAVPAPSVLLGHAEVAGSLTPQGYALLGGSFEFSQGELESVGADTIALGHYHRRQGAYVGAPCQQTWGEAGNPCGYRLIETDGISVVRSEYIEIDVPKFVVVTPDEYDAKKIRPQDRIRVTGSESQVKSDLFEALPENVSFAPPKEKAVFQMRVEGIDPEDAPADLLAAWFGVNPVPDACLEDLQTALGELQADLPPAAVTGAGVGSLTAIREVRIRGIASHADTHVVFPDGFFGISGAIGTGKSFLLGALPGVAYGDFPHVPGSLYDHMPQNGTGEASIEVVFESAGKVYRALRNLRQSASGKSKSQECYLYEVQKGGADQKAIAGPKEGDFSRAIGEILGDKKLFLASAFSAQGGTGDMISMDPSDRQKIFSQWLGMDRLEEIAKAASSKVDRLTGTVESDVRRAEALRGVPAELESARQRAVDVDSDRARVTAELSSRESEEKSAQERLTAARELEQRKSGLQGRRGDAESELRAIETTIGDLKDRIQKGKDLLEKEPALRAEVEELRKVRVEVEQDRERRAGLAALDSAVSVAAAAVVSAKADLEGLRSAEVQRLQGELRSQEKKKSSMEADRTKALQKVADEKGRLEAVLDLARREVARLTRQAALIQTTQCQDGFECPLLADAQGAAGKLVEQTAQVSALEETLLGEEYAREARDTAEMAEETLLDVGVEIGETEQAIDIVRLPAWGDHTEIAAAEVAHGGAVEAARVAREALPKLATDARARLSRLEDAERELQGMDRYRERLAGLEEQKAAKDGEAVSKRDAIARLADDIAAIPPFDPEADKSALDSAQKSTRDSREALSSLERQAGSLQATVADLDKQANEAAALEVGLAVSRRKIGLFAVLRDAFGRRGIPQLLIDTIRPQIQEILDTLLEGLAHSIRIDTQRATNNGKTFKETFDIMVSDAAGERDIRQFSGGEQKFLRSIFRQSLGLWQASRHGKRIQVFAADEAFDSLDRETSMILLGSLAHLQDRFRQVWIVSHSDELLLDIPDRARLEKIRGVTQLELTGAVEPAGQGVVA